MSYELTGTLYEKFDEIQRTPTFKVREFVIENTKEINGNVITNLIKFQCTQDRTGLIEDINKGEQVKVYFNIRGSRWERDGKVSYFNNLEVWKVERFVAATTSSAPANDLPGQTTFESDDDATDLPF